jgi:hypothetical protein
LGFFFSITGTEVSAQGVQTGVLTGVARDQAGLPLPGASVTVTSPALQGARSTVTDDIGVYNLRGLPPGTYRARFELSGLSPLEQTVEVPLGTTARLDATLGMNAVQEAVSVTADITPTPLASTQTSANYRADMVNVLPIGRTPALIAELSPGMTANTPNVGQVAIGGGFAFDSIFLIDGVDTNDNLFGNSHGLYIEDAIQETQVLTSGISAEYGRFAGGVVNVITKSGGNSFHGSFRTNFAKPSWTQETPFEVERSQVRSSTLSKFFEGTIGGPVLKDRLWFFNADRYENSTTARILNDVGTTYDEGTNNKRAEIKFTGTVLKNHTVSGSYLNNPRTQNNLASLNTTSAMDPAVLINRETPNNLWVANWQGILSSKMLATFQYSKKHFGFRNAGGTSTDIHDSPIQARGILSGATNGRHYNAPFFSALDPEDRNNRQFAGSVSYYVTSPKVGRHDMKGGFEHFTSTRTGGNSQSATGFVFATDYLVDGGRPVLDANQHPIPVWGGNAANPGAAASRVTNWISVTGSEIDVRTLSLYVQDRWTINNHLNFDIGLRYEGARSDATGGIVGADTNDLVPRLGATFDPTGDGRNILQATYAHYSGRFSERAFARNTTVGTPSSVNYAYIGPSGQGRDFAPAFDLNNYAVIGGNFPTVNVFFDDNLHSPLSKEFTVSFGRRFAKDGYAKAQYVFRTTDGFIEDFVDDPTANGKVPVTFQGRTFNPADKVFYTNTDDPTREYQALQFESRLRFTSKLYVQGHWTVQLKQDGNFEGEAANQPGNTELFFNYPEILDETRYFPSGHLNEYQRHKVRIWTTYNQGLGRLGSVDFSPIWRINSGLTYSLAAANVAHSAVQLARNPGYLRTAGGGQSATLFFDERGSESFKGFALVDLAMNYGIPVWKELRPWVQVQIYNLLNNQKQIQWDTTVTPDPASPLDSLGQPTGYIQGPNFGKATAADQFPIWAPGETGGRTFRVAFGVRF